MSNTNFLYNLLKRRDEEVYSRFIELNTKLDNEKFIFIFPYEFKFNDYTSLDSLLIQLQILLHKIKLPFNKKFVIENYYNKLFNAHDINLKVTFDLSKTVFIGNLELLMVHNLGYFCYKLTDQKVKVIFNSEKIDWLTTWNFFNHYYEWGEKNDETKNIFQSTHIRDSEKLIPIRKISDFSDVDKTVRYFFAKKIITLLEAQYGMSESLIHNFVTDVISEMCQNIPQHSKSIGFIIVHAHMQEIYLFSMPLEYKKFMRDKKVCSYIRQIFEKHKVALSNAAEIIISHGRGYAIRDGKIQYIIKDTGTMLNIYAESNRIPDIEIALSDCGIGIRQSLYNRYPNTYENKTHYQVIKEVLEGEFMRPEHQHNGGILRAREFVEAFGGRILIRSVCAKAGNMQNSVYHDYDKDWRFFPGTQVSILIPRLSVKKLNRGL